MLRNLPDKIEERDIAHAITLSRELVGGTPAPRGTKGEFNPHVARFLTKDGRTVSVFHVRPNYYETVAGTWRPLKEVCSKVGNKHIILNDNWRQISPRFLQWLNRRAEILNGSISIPSTWANTQAQYYFHDLVSVPKLGLTVTDFVPDPNPETTTVDGRIWYTNPGDTSWGTVNGAATGSGAQDSATLGYTWFGAGTTSNSWRSVERSVFLFDTSSITDTDSIDSATLVVRGTGKQNTMSGAGELVGVYTSAPTSNTALVTGDFDQFGTTLQSDEISNASWSTSADNTFTLNATGRGNVDATGVSKFAIRIDLDADITAPSGWVSDGNNWCIFEYAENAAGNDPTLSVTHSAGGGGGPTFIPKVMMF